MSSKQQDSADSLWQSLKDPPDSSLLGTVAINNSEYLKMGVSDYGLIRYNVVHNKWESIDTFNYSNPHSVDSWSKIYSFDKDSKLLIMATSREEVITINMETGSCNKIWTASEHGIRGAFLIDNKLHILGCRSIMGGGTRLSHLVIDDKNEYTEQSVLSDARLHDAVFSESRNSLIVFGSASGRANEGTAPLFAEYSLSTNQWERWSDATTYWKRAGMLCTSDGKYLICLGRVAMRDDNTNNAEYIDGIVVYDLNDHSAQSRLSAVRCPKLGHYEVLLMTDKRTETLVTFGYVRKCYENPQLKEMENLPEHIIEMIAIWVCMEWIHLLIRHGGKGHWRISLDEILKSV